jgi:integrase
MSGQVGALRQALEAAVRWNYIDENPAKLAGPNPQPPALELVPFPDDEFGLVAAELGAEYGPLVVFACETGLRPEEWIASERRDIDRERRVVRVERSVLDGVAKAYGKTSRFRRSVPLSDLALTALDAIPLRIDGRLTAAPRGGYLSLRNWRRREWQPALRSAGLAPCTCGHRSGGMSRVGLRARPLPLPRIRVRHEARREPDALRATSYVRLEPARRG